MSYTFDFPFRKLFRLTPLLLILVSSVIGLTVNVTSGQAQTVKKKIAKALAVPGISTTTGYISTVAGTSGVQGYSGDGGQAIAAELEGPVAVATDSSGNLYIADWVGTGSSSYIRKVNAQGVISTIAGGPNSVSASASGGGDATKVYLENPKGVAVDSSGNYYISETGRHAIDVVNGSTNVISVFAGEPTFGSGSTGDGGLASSALLNSPQQIFVDASGNLYIADTGNHAIRVVYKAGTLPGLSSLGVGKIYTIAGTITSSCSSATAACGDGSAANLAQLNSPGAIAVDNNGNLYIADTTDNRLRVVYNSGAAVACLIALENPGSFTLPSGTTSCAGTTPPTPNPFPTAGAIYTIAGNGQQCGSGCGDGGLATSAYLTPNGVVVDEAGNVFITDGYDYAIREVNAQTGLISIVAGDDINFTSGATGDGGLATLALLSTSAGGIALDSSGNLYIADTGNYNVRAIAGAGTVVAQSQTISFNETLPETTYGTTAIDISKLATATSGLAASYSVDSNSPATVDNTALTLTLTGAGTVTVIASQKGGTLNGITYAAATSVSQQFTVDKATLTVTANKASVPFGTSVSALASTYETYTPSGLVGADSLTGAPAYTISNCSDGNATYTTTTVAGTTCTITPTVNTLAISPTTQASSYYSPFTYVSNTLTVVGGDTQTITFPTLTGPFTYGMSPIALSATATSKQPVSYSVDNTLVATITGDSTSGYYLTIKGAGQVTVTASQGGTNNYAPAQSVNQVLTIGRATVTVTPGSLLSVPYGSTPSSLPFSFTASSLVGTNDQLTGTPAYTTNCGGGAAYSTTTAVGTNCTISVSGLSISPTADASNYTINYATGALTVIQGTQTISWLQPGNVTYAGGATQTVTITATATSGLPVTATVLSGPAAVVSGTTVQTTGGGSVLGVGTVTVQLTQGGSTNYAAAAPVTVSFKVNPATLYVKANDLTMAPGATVPTLTWSFTCNSSGGNSCSNDFVGTDTNTSAVVSGLPVLSTSATSTSSTGSYAIDIAQGTLAAQNYSILTVNGTLTITGAPTYIVTANPSTLTIRAGQTGQATILVTPTNGYQGTVTFSCGNLPTNVTCTFSPASVTLAANSSGGVLAQESTLTVNTNASSPVVGMLSAPHKGSQVLTASLFFLPGGLTGLLIAFNRKRLRKYRGWQAMMILGVLMSGLMGLSACGGSTTKNVATTGTNTITITAAATGTSGSGSPNATNALNLTVVITQ